TEGVVYAALTADPQHIDDLSVAVELTIAEVATALMMLELQGLVRNTGAQYYARQRSRGRVKSLSVGHNRDVSPLDIQRSPFLVLKIGS
ncbi:MAG: hypothetical protein ACRDHN_00425, partial [Thermomicrobiales bacterium]